MTHLHRRRLLFIIALCALALLPGLGRQSMTRQQELRVALTARTMAQGGGWVVPVFRGQVRLEKPPLAYWVTALVAKACGTSRSPYAARLPAALAGMALVAAVYLGGAWWVGRASAFLAAVVAATSWLLVRHAALAETDVPLALFTTLAVLRLSRALMVGPDTVSWILAALAAGLGFMVKGPAAIVIPALTGLLFVVSSRGGGRGSRGWHVAVAGLVVILVVLPWYAAVFHYTHTQSAASTAVKSELGKLVIESEHPGPWYYYFYTLPVGLLPWGVLLPFALWQTWKERSRSGLWFVWCWWLVTFALLSVVTSKQEHYALLLLPPSAILLGRYLHVRARRCTWDMHRAVAAAAVLLVVLVNVHHFLLYPHYERRSLLPPLAAEARKLAGDEHETYAVGRYAASLDFYLGHAPKERATIKDAWQEAKDGAVIVAVSTPKTPTDLSGTDIPPVYETTLGSMRCALFVKH